MLGNQRLHASATAWPRKSCCSMQCTHLSTSGQLKMSGLTHKYSTIVKVHSGVEECKITVQMFDLTSSTLQTINAHAFSIFHAQ
jgi:hypothetical protein